MRPRREGAGRQARARARARVPARVRRALLERLARLLAGRQVMRVTMATHQRKCILQETLIPSPRSWDSLTFHSHTVIRYQLSVQGGRLHGCSPAGVCVWGGVCIEEGGRGDGDVKDTGALGARAPGLLARRRVPAHLETLPAPGTRPSHAHLLRARPPARQPAHPLPPLLLPRLLVLRTPALLRPPSRRCPPVLCAGRYLWVLQGGPPPLYVPGAVPSPDSCNSPSPSVVKRLRGSSPKAQRGVAICPGSIQT